MKKIVCQLLIVWLAVLSGSVSAHATQHAAHQAMAIHDHASHSESVQTAATDITAAQSATPEAAHADVCSLSHCGHSHAADLLTPYKVFFKDCAESCGPTSHALWTTSAIASNIERPKWPFTTPAVVSHLS